MKKSTCNKKCIHCKSDDVKYNGYAKGGRHRYHCNSCNKNFVDNPKIKITNITERVINTLYNVLENNFYGEKSLKKSFEKAKNNKKSDKVQCISRHIEDTACGYYIDNCKNPKLIICTEYNKLIFYKIPKSRSQKNSCKVSVE